MYCGAAYSNETSTVYVLFMSFFVIPREIREINKPGGGVKISCGGSAEITKKINVSPRFILNLRVGAGVENCVQDKTEQHFNIPCIFKNSTQKNFFIILFFNLGFLDFLQQRCSLISKSVLTNIYHKYNTPIHQAPHYTRRF